MVAFVQSLYDALSLGVQANDGDFIGLVMIAFLLISSLFFFLAKSEPTARSEIQATPEKKPVQAAEAFKKPIEEKAKVEQEKPLEPVVSESVEEATEVVSEEPKVSWRERLSSGLGRSRKEVFGKVFSLFSSGGLDSDALEEIEELLYGADLGPSLVQELIEVLEEKVKRESLTEQQFKDFFYNFLFERMEPQQKKLDEDLFHFDESKRGKTKTIMIVGVNGAGKTTTIGKLATKLTRQGANVVVGACDTFRAAAVDQLQIWCERAGAEMIRAKEGSNPSGVGYDALQAAKNKNADYCLLDTAGRLHTAGNLMEELKKSKDVLKKLDDTAPDHVLLVLDAITGQNALRQAEEFHKTLNLSGLIFTKCDGSSKAGSAVGITEKLGVPITYIGVGEDVEDLNAFQLEDFLNALLDRQPQMQH